MGSERFHVGSSYSRVVNKRNGTTDREGAIGDNEKQPYCSNGQTPTHITAFCSPPCSCPFKGRRIHWVVGTQAQINHMVMEFSPRSTSIVATCSLVAKLSREEIIRAYREFTALDHNGCCGGGSWTVVYPEQISTYSIGVKYRVSILIALQ